MDFGFGDESSQQEVELCVLLFKIVEGSRASDDFLKDGCCLRFVFLLAECHCCWLIHHLFFPSLMSLMITSHKLLPFLGYPGA